jgi:hypothetical protein
LEERIDGRKKAGMRMGMTTSFSTSFSSCQELQQLALDYLVHNVNRGRKFQREFCMIKRRERSR